MKNIFNISRYRKFHLFGEDGVQSTIEPDLTTFRTDFNVTFGVCICFDLIFDYPSNGLVERGVRNFVYPTMWFSEIPYLSGELQAIFMQNTNSLKIKTRCPLKQMLKIALIGIDFLICSGSIPTKLGILKQCEFTGCKHQLAEQKLFRKWYLCRSNGCFGIICQSKSDDENFNC